MLNIQHLTKAYGDKKAVDDLSLHIAPGEIYGFIGHNGAGKTTTLKSIVGILQFDSGEITIDGISIKADPAGLQAQDCLHPRQSRSVRIYDRNTIPELHCRYIWRECE